VSLLSKDESTQESYPCTPVYNEYLQSDGEDNNRYSIEKLQPDEDDNTCIFVIIDSFRKSAAKALLSHIGRYGAPSQISSDNGRNFVSDMIKELILMVGS